MSLFAALCVIALILGVVLINVVWTDLIRERHREKPQDPEAILAERYARGEIDETEYARRLSTLTFGPPLELDR